MKTAIIWLNTEYYTPLQLSLFGLGAILWIINYTCLVRSIVKHKFVEMPAGVLCANFAWEFLWAFVFVQNMGLLIGIGYKLWFFLDVFIVIGFFKYGFKQVTEEMVPYYRLLFAFAILGWLVVLYFFQVQGFDNPIGANSAYVINILISSLYILMLVRMKDKSILSFTAAWTKAFGTGFISLMCALRWSNNYLMISMCTICFILDLFYLYLFVKLARKKG